MRLLNVFITSLLILHVHSILNRIRNYNQSLISMKELNIHVPQGKVRLFHVIKLFIKLFVTEYQNILQIGYVYA